METGAAAVGPPEANASFSGAVLPSSDPMPMKEKGRKGDGGESGGGNPSCTGSRCLSDKGGGGGAAPLPLRLCTESDADGLWCASLFRFPRERERLRRRGRKGGAWRASSAEDAANGSSHASTMYRALRWSSPQSSQKIASMSSQRRGGDASQEGRWTDLLLGVCLAVVRGCCRSDRPSPRGGIDETPMASYDALFFVVGTTITASFSTAFMHHDPHCNICSIKTDVVAAHSNACSTTSAERYKARR